MIKHCKQIKHEKVPGDQTLFIVANVFLLHVCLCVSSLQELLRRESGFVLPVAGLVYQTAGPGRCSGRGRFPLWTCLFQLQPSNVSQKLRRQYYMVNELKRGKHWSFLLT